MSGSKTIVTFNSGRTVTLNGDWVAALNEMDNITKFQGFPLDDVNRCNTIINMDLVETVKVVEDDD